MVILLTYHIREETRLLETPHNATLWMYLINMIYVEWKWALVCPTKLQQDQALALLLDPCKAQKLQVTFHPGESIKQPYTETKGLNAGRHYCLPQWYTKLCWLEVTHPCPTCRCQAPVTTIGSLAQLLDHWLGSLAQLLDHWHSYWIGGTTIGSLAQLLDRWQRRSCPLENNVRLFQLVFKNMLSLGLYFEIIISVIFYLHWKVVYEEAYI